MGCELRSQWLMTRAPCVRPRGRRLRAGWQIATCEKESGLRKQVSCPKVKSLLTNQLKVGPGDSNTGVMAATASHTSTYKSFSPTEAQYVHSNTTMCWQDMRGNGTGIFIYKLVTGSGPQRTFSDPQRKRERRQKGALRDVCPSVQWDAQTLLRSSKVFTDVTQQTLTRCEWRRPCTWLDCLTDEDLQLPPCRTD